MTEQLNPELKNCPFCGGRATLSFGDSINTKTLYFIECGKCFVGGLKYYSLEDAKIFWNTRAENKCEHEFVTRKDAERKDSTECIKCYKKPNIEEKINNKPCSKLNNHLWKYDKYGRNIGCIYCGVIPFE